MGYFRTDYAVAGVSLSFKDSILVHSIADKISNRGYNVWLPAIYYPVAPATTSSEIISTLVDLAKKRQSVRLKSERHKEDLKTTKDQNILMYYSRAIQILDDATELYDDFFSRFTTIASGKIPLRDVLLETELVRILKDGGRLLIVKIQKAGGSHYTKKNIVTTLFGGMPFYHMGGAVVSFVLLNGRDGSVEYSGVVPIHGGFVKADKVETHLKEKRLPSRCHDIGNRGLSAD